MTGKHKQPILIEVPERTIPARTIPAHFVEARICEQCGEPFAGRADARFCSTRCRVAHHRAVKRAGKTNVGTSS